MIAWLAWTAPASAQGWSSFAAAFPQFPCQDGWSGCMVYGQHVDPELRRDQAGRALPADARVGWFDLEATASFSPFVGLSVYPNEAVEVAVADPPAADGGSQEMARLADVAAADAEAARAARIEAQRQQQQAEEARKQADLEAQRQRAEEDQARKAAAEAARKAAAANQVAEAEEQAKLKKEAELAAAKAAEMERKRLEADKAAEARRLEEEAARRKAAEEEERRKAAEAARQQAEADAQRAMEEEQRRKQAEAEQQSASDAAAVEGDCADVQALETKALLGQLSEATTSCLETRLANAPKMTDKKRVSSVLMANAWAKGDKDGWESLVKRHLDEIDQSDPDLCYKYALHLSRQGPSRASGVIRWANVALENRMVWIGDTYTSRVYSLYKVRAAASQALWMQAEQEHTGSPNDNTREKVDKYRNLTKVNAREWYEYAKSSGKDANLALQLCMSAAGTSDYCDAT
jgi:hypothetical protein